MGDDRSDERRVHPRSMVLVAAEIDHPNVDRQAIALIRDVSSSGARLLCRRPPEQGGTVDVTLHFGSGPEGKTHHMKADVVRVVPLDSNHRDLWSHEVAVKFTEELTGYDTELAELAERARKLAL